MTNYTQSTNFATKDALTSGDPLKILKGTEINTEFANIAIAVATKADLISPTFTSNLTVSGVTSLQATSATNLSYTGTLTGSTGVINIGSGQLYKDASGNVNIGSTSNYGGLLSVNRAQTSSIADLLTLRDASAGVTFNLQTYADPTYGTSNRFNYDGGYLAFRRSGTEQMRIDGTTGDVTIGGAIAGGAITSSGVPVVTTTGTQTLTNKTTTTQATSTNNTTIATTAFVQAVMQTLHPVGSIYINATNSTNPGTLLGFGTWTAFGAGRVPVGFNAANALFDTAEETGGSADATLPSHTHTATVTDPGHNHTLQTSLLSAGLTSGNHPASATGSNTGSAFTGITVANSTEGSSGTNANYQPYITVYMWKRTA